MIRDMEKESSDCIISANKEVNLVPNLCKNGTKSNVDLAPKSRKRLLLDFSERDQELTKTIALLDELNNKKFGQKISLTDLFVHCLLKIGPKDMEQLRQESLTAREKITISWQQFNEKSGLNLGLDEFICKQLKI